MNSQHSKSVFRELREAHKAPWSVLQLPAPRQGKVSCLANTLETSLSWISRGLGYA